MSEETKINRKALETLRNDVECKVQNGLPKHGGQGSRSSGEK